MRENNYNANNMNENSEVNGMNNDYNGFSTDCGSTKKAKKNTTVKIAASLMAMVLVSGGSIGIYRQVSGSSTNMIELVTEL
jgi:serine protease Do